MKMNPPYLLNSFFTRNSEPWSPLYFLTGGQTLCTLCTNVPYFPRNVKNKDLTPIPFYPFLSLSIPTSCRGEFYLERRAVLKRRKWNKYGKCPNILKIGGDRDETCRKQYD